MKHKQHQVRDGVADVMREHITIVEGAGGPKAVIVGHRTRVQDVAVWHEKLGTSPDEIVHEYPTIPLPMCMRPSRTTGTIAMRSSERWQRSTNWPKSFAGWKIVYTVQGTRTIGQLVEGLILIYEVLAPSEMAGRVEYL